MALTSEFIAFSQVSAELHAVVTDLKVHDRSHDVRPMGVDPLEFATRPVTVAGRSARLRGLPAIVVRRNASVSGRTADNGG